MLDAHVHLERGPYTAEWLTEFVTAAGQRGITELCLLDHSYLFREFVPLYDDLRRASPFIDAWLTRKSGVHDLADYLTFVESVRKYDFGLPLRFGLEVCFLPTRLPETERLLRDLPLDFTVGSIHFIDNFAFDHTPDLWQNVNPDQAYRRFFDLSVQLAQSRLFDGIAHPDSVRLFGHTPAYPLDEAYDTIAAALADAGMYAEQNSGTARRTASSPGMAPALYASMKRHGVPIRTASDAHRPSDTGDGISYFYEKNLT